MTIHQNNRLRQKASMEMQISAKTGTRTSMIRGVVAAAAGLMAIAVLSGCGSKQDASNATFAKAEAIYKQQCLSCHGDQLQGRMWPETNLTKVGGRLSRDQIAAQITNGSSGMIPFKDKLTAEEIGALADWLSTKK